MTRHRRTTLLFAILVLAARTASAGPPLVCFPFDIGAAKTLPMAGKGWEAVDPKYDASRLADDTIAILTANASVLVHMETIRRAAIYESKSPGSAQALMSRLENRAKQPGIQTLAIFDWGYAIDTFKQAGLAFNTRMPVRSGVDGYQLVLKAAEASGDPAMQFALAVITQDHRTPTPEHHAHLQRAAAGAKDGDLLAANLQSHFGKPLADLRR